MAEWLQRRITKTTKRLADARLKLEACGHPSDFLRQQFVEQHAYQSKPLTRKCLSTSEPTCALTNCWNRAIEK